MLWVFEVESTDLVDWYFDEKSTYTYRFLKEWRKCGVLLCDSKREYYSDLRKNIEQRISERGMCCPSHLHSVLEKFGIDFLVWDRSVLGEYPTDCDLWRVGKLNFDYLNEQIDSVERCISITKRESLRALLKTDIKLHNHIIIVDSYLANDKQLSARKWLAEFMEYSGWEGCLACYCGYEGRDVIKLEKKEGETNRELKERKKIVSLENKLVVERTLRNEFGFLNEHPDTRLEITAIESCHISKKEHDRYIGFTNTCGSGIFHAIAIGSGIKAVDTEKDKGLTMSWIPSPQFHDVLKRLNAAKSG